MTDNRPLAGIRVFELSIAVAGPQCGRYLAHFGAEVIRVESRRYPDGTRRGAHWLRQDTYGPGVWGDTNPTVGEGLAGKRSLDIDLKTPKGAEAAKRLIAKCDVFLANFSAPAVKGLGLDYESLRSFKPDIVYALLSGFGATSSPYYDYLAWGPNQSPLCGLDDLTGWPDRPPSGIANCAYPDYANAAHMVFAILAALDHRDRTGRGQLIDLSQFEATVSLLGPLLLNHQANYRIISRLGNRLDWAAPQGVYPCRGEEKWVALTVSTETEWRALCHVFEHAEWIEDPRFRSTRNRLDHHDELDQLLAVWTCQRTSAEIAEHLQRAGVAAAPVMDGMALAADEHLQSRDFWIVADHARFGKDIVTGNPVNLSETPGRVDRAAPAAGEDNEYVLGEICGYSPAEIEAMVAEGAVNPMASPETRLKRPYLRWIRHLMPHLPWPETEYDEP
ncbi:MAG: CoA transferase [Dehalococcoidia bacterium]|nr:CoA transferase [Dehalococcoidia bacterium]